MSLEDKVDKLAEESYKFHGEMRAALTGLTGYIGSVSRRVDQDKKELRDLVDGHFADHSAELKEQIKTDKDSAKEIVKAGREWWAILAPIGISVLLELGHVIWSKG